MKFLAVFILVALPMICLGLKCLECTFASSSSNMHDGSCVDGGIEHSVECTKETDWPEYPIQLKNIRSEMHQSNSTVTEGRQVEFSCYESYGYVFKTKYTERGCVLNTNEVCDEVNVTGLASRNWCVCNTNNCNNSQGSTSNNTTAYPVFVLLSALIFSIKFSGKW